MELHAPPRNHERQQMRTLLALTGITALYALADNANKLPDIAGVILLAGIFIGMIWGVITVLKKWK